MCDVSHDLLKGENIYFSTQTSKRAPMKNGRGISTEAAGSLGSECDHKALSLKEWGKRGPESRHHRGETEQRLEEGHIHLCLSLRSVSPDSGRGPSPPAALGNLWQLGGRASGPTWESAHIS